VEKILVDLSIKDFAKSVASHESIIPAGGCVMALSGLMGICLLEMSAKSACERPEGKEYENFFREARAQLTELHSELLTCIERDAEAYGGLLAAYKLQKSTEKEAEQRRAKIQIAALSSIEIPLKISEACILALDLGIMLLPKITNSMRGDLKVGLLVIRAGIEGSLANAKMNLPLLKEDTIIEGVQSRIDELQVKFDTVITGLQ
jgi:formiminotetrahydrofolate cyclodeaminase